MLCENPYNNAQGMLFPCGQCMPCRINRRREWTHRLMLEKKMHPDTCFITLTYADEHLRMSALGYPTLVPEHFTLWLKRLREAIKPLKIRYYGVGEYGDQTQRPHYHLVVFGMPMCMRGRTMRDVRTNRCLWGTCCSQCKLVGDTWGKGDIELGELNEESAQYLAQYTTKKLNKDDLRLMDRYPERAWMSRKNGGIGFGALDAIADVVLQHGLHLRDGDVPGTLRHGRRIWPLGRYLRRQLREKVGMAKEAPQVTLDAAQAKLQPLREIAFESSQSFKAVVVEAGSNQRRRMEYLGELRKKRRSL